MEYLYLKQLKILTSNWQLYNQMSVHVASVRETEPELYLPVCADHPRAITDSETKPCIKVRISSDGTEVKIHLSCNASCMASCET